MVFITLISCKKKKQLESSSAIFGLDNIGEIAVTNMAAQYNQWTISIFIRASFKPIIIEYSTIDQ